MPIRSNSISGSSWPNSKCLNTVVTSHTCAFPPLTCIFEASPRMKCSSAENTMGRSSTSKGLLSRDAASPGKATGTTSSLVKAVSY